MTRFLFFKLLFIFGAAFLIVGSVIPMFADAGLAETPWPMFRHDVHHTGRSSFIGPEFPEEKWSFPTGGGVFSSPAIGVDGTIIYVGSDDLKLYAIKPDGTLKWTFDTDPSGNVQSSPAIGDDGTIYVGSWLGKVHAVNPDGSPKWSFDTESGAPVRSSPAIGNDGTIYAGSDDGSFYALNSDGTLQWKFPTGGGIQSSSAIGTDGTIYIGSSDGKLYALNPDGTKRWDFLVGGNVSSSPAIGSDGTIYAGSEFGRLYAVNPDGSLKWSFTAGGGILSSPGIGSDGTIYFGTSHFDYKLYALNPNGTLKWSFPAGDVIFSSAAIDNEGTIYFGSNDRKLYALNPDGTLKWSFTAGGAVQSSPAIGPDRTIYFGTHDDRKLYALGPALPPVPDDISIEISIPQELSVNELGWYAQNPSELRVLVTNNTAEIFIGPVEVTFSNSDRLVFDDGDTLPVQAPSELRRFIGFPGLDPNDSIEVVWPMWVQPMSEQSIVFTAQAFDNITGELKGQDAAAMSVLTAQVHPVVVIPGIMGSWKNFSGEWEIDPLTGRYNNLLGELRLAGYEDDITLFTFPYDWRQHTASSASELGEAIGEFLSAAEASGQDYVVSSSLDIVAHSQGGLVSRAYIQGDSYADDVHRLFTLGTPHRGTPQAYVDAEGLEFIDEGFPLLRDIKEIVFRTLARKNGYCTKAFRFIPVFGCWAIDANVHQYIREQVPSTRELFPDDSYLSDEGGGYLINADDPTDLYPFERQVNNFLNSLNANVDLLVSRLGSDSILAFVGNRPDSDTDGLYRVVKPGSADKPLWTNGKVGKEKEFRPSTEGDQTVPRESADLSLIDSRVQKKEETSGDNGSKIVHGNLPTQLQQTIVDRLTGGRPFFATGFLVRYFDPLVRNPLVFYNLSPVEIQIIDPAGRRAGVDFGTGNELSEIPDTFFSRSNLVNEPDLIFVADPLEGEYNIALQGIMDGEYTVGMEQLTGEGILTIAEFSGTTSLGAEHEHTAVYDLEILPVTPLSLEWHLPLDNSDEPHKFNQSSTIPIKFTIRDAQGTFVADESVYVWITDPTNPSEAIVSFTGAGPAIHGRSDTVRIDLEEQHYIANLNLRDYGLELGKTYIVTAGIFGDQLGTNAFTTSKGQK